MLPLGVIITITIMCPNNYKRRTVNDAFWPWKHNKSKLKEGSECVCVRVCLYTHLDLIFFSLSVIFLEFTSNPLYFLLIFHLISSHSFSSLPVDLPSQFFFTFLLLSQSSFKQEVDKQYIFHYLPKFCPFHQHCKTFVILYMIHLYL